MRSVSLKDLKGDSEVYKQLFNSTYHNTTDDTSVTVWIEKHPTDSTGLVIDANCRIRAVMMGSPAERSDMKQYLSWSIRCINGVRVVNPQTLSQFSECRQLRLVLGKFSNRSRESTIVSSDLSDCSSTPTTRSDSMSSMGRAPSQNRLCLIEITRFNSSVPNIITSQHL